MTRYRTREWALAVLAGIPIRGPVLDMGRAFGLTRCTRRDICRVAPRWGFR